MNVAEARDALVREMSEDFEDDDILCLYEFSWFLSDFRGSLDDSQIERACREAYDVLRERFPLKLVWVDWPKVEPECARDAEPDTPLDFQISADGEVKSPMLALVRL